MTARHRFASIARWGACFALVLGVHAAGAMALLDWHTEAASIASGPVILIDLAPAPAAPSTKKSDLPPDPQQPQAQAAPEPTPKPTKSAQKAELTPTPDKKVETVQAKPVIKPDPAPEKPHVETAPVPPTHQEDDVLTVLPPPRPHLTLRQREAKHQPPKPRRRASHASTPSAPSAAAHHAARSIAPAPGTARRNPNAVPTWKSQLLARLERYKRYPPEAQSRGEQGVAQLAFNIDRRGGVHNVRIVRSSGSSLLDRATLALPRRAAPLPPPPTILSGRRVSIVVPIRYSIR